MSFTMTFNGVELPINVSDVGGRGPYRQETTRTTVPGRPGSIYRKRRITERPLPVTFSMKSTSMDQLRIDVDNLNAILNVDEPCAIVFSDEPDKTYYGILDGDPDWDEIIDIGKGTLNFICPDPDKIGQSKNAPKNLIPPFTDPAWALTAQAKAISPYELELDATATYQSSFVDIPVFQNMSYYISFKSPVVWCSLRSLDNNKNELDRKDIINNSSSAYVTVNNASYLRIYLGNANALGTFTFSNPQLELGDTSTPFQARRGLNMLPPFTDPGWNLHANAKVINPYEMELDATGASQDSWISIPVINGQSYTLSSEHTGLIRVYKTKTQSISSTQILGDNGTFIVDSAFNGYVSLRLTCGSVGTFTFTNPQLEPGDTATPFQPQKGGTTIAYGGTAEAQPVVTVSFPKNVYTTDFLGKVSGSTVENPNIAKGRSQAGLAAPTQFTYEFNAEYAQINILDGTAGTVSSNVSTYQAQELFSFNLIALVESQLGKSIGATTADKVAWLKANVTQITANWWGYGNGPSGNKATLKCWDIPSASYSASSVYTTSSVPTEISYSIESYIGNKIDSNGFIYFLSYADASDGTTASTIYTDYINLVVELNNTATFFKISKDDKFVKVNRSFVNDDELVLDFKKRKVSVNGIVDMKSLEWDTSEWFTIDSNDSIIYWDSDGNTVNVDVAFDERWL